MDEKKEEKKEEKKKDDEKKEKLIGNEPVQKPEPPAAQTPEYKKAAKERKERAEKLLKDCQDVLKEYGGIESNIPVGHNYWIWMNEYRSVSKEPFEG